MSSSSHSTPHPLRPLGLVVAGVMLVVAFFKSPFSGALDRAFFDLSSRHPWEAPALPGNSALVLVDDASLASLSQSELGMRWPFPRIAFAGLIAALERAGAARIVLDFTFIDPSEAAEQDQWLGVTAAAVRATVLARTPEHPPVVWKADFIRAHPDLFIRPRMGDVTLQLDPDGVARHYHAPGSLADAALNTPTRAPGGLLRWHGGLAEVREQRAVRVLSAGRFLLAGLGLMDRISQRTPEPTTAGVIEALAQEPALTGPGFDEVRGRTVFVGANASGTFDMKPTPVGPAEPGVLLHWTAWTNLLAGGFIKEIPASLALLAAVLVALLIIATAVTSPGLRVAGIVATLLALGLLGGAYAGLRAGWFFPPAVPLAATLITLLGVSAESFWRERERKRNVQALFGAYVDPAVVSLLMRDPDAINLGGERREATVFFSDLAGFTDLSEKLPPDQLVTVVNAYLQETSDCLIDYGAYVDKYIGDAVMAVFGAPQPQADHALAACKAALAAQRRLDGINARLATTTTGVTLRMRIGLNTGDLIVGNIGSSRKRNYTVMGDTVNLASRLEGANKELDTAILLGPATAAAVQGTLATRPLARLRVKGKSLAVEVHELIGSHAELTPARKQFLSAYLAGYTAFGERRFAEALEALDRALALVPGDSVSQRLRARVAEWVVTPPPPSWEPILSLETK